MCPDCTIGIAHLQHMVDTGHVKIDQRTGTVDLTPSGSSEAVQHSEDPTVHPNPYCVIIEALDVLTAIAEVDHMPAAGLVWIERATRCLNNDPELLGLMSDAECREQATWAAQLVKDAVQLFTGTPDTTHLTTAEREWIARAHLLYPELKPCPDETDVETSTPDTSAADSSPAERSTGGPNEPEPIGDHDEPPISPQAA